MASARSLISIGSGIYPVFKDDRLEEEDKLFALPLLYYRCIVTINVLRLFLTVPWVGLHCVIVVFPDHTHLLFDVKIQRFVLRGYRISFPVLAFNVIITIVRICI